VFLPAVIGGLVSGLVSVLLPRVLGASSGWTVKFRGFLSGVRLAYVRSAGAALFGIGAATAISLSTENAPHNDVTYLFWWGVATMGLAIVIAATIVIDRQAAAEPAGTPRRAADENPALELDLMPLGALQQGESVVFRIRLVNPAPHDIGSVLVNFDVPHAFGLKRSASDDASGRVLESDDKSRRFWAGPIGPLHGHGTTTVEDFSVQIPADAVTFDVWLKVKAAGGWLPPVVRSFEASSAKSNAPEPTRHGPAHDLADFYKEGDRLRIQCQPPQEATTTQKLLWSLGAGPQQVEREQLARDWDAAVSDYLWAGDELKVYGPGWKEAGDPPGMAVLFGQSSVGPKTLEEWYAKKLAALAGIIKRVS
jgi:hypothetical protein